MYGFILPIGLELKQLLRLPPRDQRQRDVPAGKYMALIVLGDLSRLRRWLIHTASAHTIIPGQRALEDREEHEGRWRLLRRRLATQS